MANSRSAKKRVRQTIRKSEARTSRRSAIRGQIRKVEEAIAEGNKNSAKDTFKVMQPSLMSGTHGKVFHKNMVNRKLSRLSKRIKSMSG